MQEIFKFLQLYWQVVLGVILFVVSFIIAIIRKKPVSDVLSSIYAFAVSAVIEAEGMKVSADGSSFSSLNGKDKLSYAVNAVLSALHQVFPALDVKKYKPLVIDVIEELLTTPQKKGE